MLKLFCLAFLAAVSFPALATSPADVVSEYHAAVASGNMTKALSLLSPAVQIFESGYVERSKDEYAGHHLPADIAFEKAATRKVLKSSERIAGDLAVVMQETDTQGTHKGVPVHLIGTETTVLEKRADTWLITHFHWSSRTVK
jgi:ketosteroid isomerase-like protein